MGNGGRRSVEYAENLLVEAAQILYESTDNLGQDEDREQALNLTWSALQSVRRSRQSHHFERSRRLARKLNLSTRSTF